MSFRLVIGNKNLSSWSLRPWLVLEHFDIPFTEEMVRLDIPEERASLKEKTPSGLVPTLFDGDDAIWDSLAICEYLADRHPEKGLWPEDARDRALARCYAAEMHSGFSALRGTWPMDIVHEGKGVTVPGPVRRDISRIVALWEAARARPAAASGPFLFGRFSIADAFFAPVVSRFRTFGPVPLPPASTAYTEAVWSLPAMQRWIEGARAEAAVGSYGWSPAAEPR